VLSDVPALALALLALLVLRWANRRATLASDLALAVALAAAVYVRSANLLLLPAFALDRLCRLPSARAAGEAPGRFLVRRVLVPLAVFTVLYLPWLLTPSFTSQYDSPDLQSYSTAFLRSDPNDPGAAALGARQWVARVESNALAYAAIFTSGMATRRGSTAAPFVAGLGALALLAVLVRRREASEWFAAGTVLVLIGYYVAATRLLLPVFVLTVAAMAECAKGLLERVLAARTTERLVAACLLLVAASTIGGSAQQSGARARYESLLAATQHVRETVAEGRPLGGDVGAVYALLLDRPVYSLRPLSRRGNRKRLFKMLEERDVAAVIVRREGPMKGVVKRLGEAGNEVVTLPHHVVVHLSGAPS